MDSAYQMPEEWRTLTNINSHHYLFYYIQGFFFPLTLCGHQVHWLPQRASFDHCCSDCFGTRMPSHACSPHLDIHVALKHFYSYSGVHYTFCLLILHHHFSVLNHFYYDYFSYGDTLGNRHFQKFI